MQKIRENPRKKVISPLHCARCLCMKELESLHWNRDLHLGQNWLVVPGQWMNLDESFNINQHIINLLHIKGNNVQFYSLFFLLLHFLFFLQNTDESWGLKWIKSFWWVIEVFYLCNIHFKNNINVNIFLTTSMIHVFVAVLSISL